MKLSAVCKMYGAGVLGENRGSAPSGRPFTEDAALAGEVPSLPVCPSTYLPTCLPTCLPACLSEGVCDSEPVESDVWDAEGGVFPDVPAPPAPAVRSRRPRLLLPLLPQWLLPLSLCGGVCFLLSFLPSFLLPPSTHYIYKYIFFINIIDIYIYITYLLNIINILYIYMYYVYNI